ncbi:MAG: response regulator, partial [Gemmatimonadota bacterium]|nr:response regulator [Gemmatimonadota bacterium]
MNEARILVVDDDRAFRVSTAALLAEEGYDVEGAEDATHAAEMLEQQRFDLTLMDVRMPGLDGISLVEALRKRGETVPIMMISGFGTVESAVRALHLGADDFVTKPIEPDVLLTKVASLLDRRPVISGGTDRSHIVGKSDAWKSVTNDIEQV